MTEDRFRRHLEQHGLSPRTVNVFRKLVYNAYRKGSRDDLPWRLTRDPYRIMVSEIMLQQTQVARVRTKYEEFLTAFPDTASLAGAPLQEVLAVWQGLGYNRRGMALKRAAEAIVVRFGGVVPETPEELRTLPGIGPYTAGAIAAFAFNRPELFIETNIRSVYIHLFFHDWHGVADWEILPLLAATLDRDQPREWYYALMDYGVRLKREVPNPGRRSAHHVRQSPFPGSNRELRSSILRMILADGDSTEAKFIAHIDREPEQVRDNLRDLEREGFIVRKGKFFRIAE